MEQWVDYDAHKDLQVKRWSSSGCVYDEPLADPMEGEFHEI